MTANNAVLVENLSVAYVRRDALRGVSLTVPAGSMTALCGANGSGKTTLLKALAGLIQTSRGAIRVLGHGDTWSARADVCYHAAKPFFPARQTVAEAGRLAARLHARYDAPLLGSLLGEFGLDPAARLDTLSKGRCALALFLVSLAADAGLYLMDEPFSGIDIKTRAQMKQALLGRMDGEKTFLISTHELSDMEGLFDRLTLIADGRVALSDWADDLRETHNCSLAELARRNM